MSYYLKNTDVLKILSFVSGDLEEHAGHPEGPPVSGGGAAVAEERVRHPDPRADSGATYRRAGKKRRNLKSGQTLGGSFC
jgi:hypothetical protein